MVDGPGGLKPLGLRVEKEGKRVLRAGLRRLLPRRAPVAGPGDPASVEKVLVVRQDSRLGNLLLITPLLRGLKLAFPRAEVHVLISQAYGEVYKNNPSLDRLLVLPQEMFWPDPGLPFRLLGQVRARHYDIAFDASHMHAFSMTSAVITALTGARVLVGYDRGDAGFYLNHLVPPPAPPRHEMELLLNLARDVAPGARLPEPGRLKPEFFLTPEEKEEGRSLWKSWGADPETLAFFLGARGSKRWETANFIELAAALGATGRRAILFGGPAEKAVLAGLKLPDGARVAPPLPLRGFAAAMANARAVVTADSGPLHLAAALGTPTVEIFMSSEAWRFGYAHLSGHRVVNAMGRSATVAEVRAALEDLLRAPRAAQPGDERG